MNGTRVALCVALLALAACGSDGGKTGDKDTDAGTTPGDGSPGGDAGPTDPSMVGTVTGRVIYADGVAVGQVDVAVGDQKVRTDSRGVFVANDVPKGKTKVKVESATVSAGQIEVAVDNGKSAQVDIAVLPMTTIEVADSTKAGTVTGDDGVVVAMDTKTFKTKKGQESSGAATASYGLVKTGVDVKAAPGGMLAMMGDAPVQLESFGMIDLRFYQDDEELVLAKPIVIDLPLGPNGFTMGQEVDVWSFDVALGLWKVEGKATVDKTTGNGFAKLTAPHLSWWSIAAPLPATTCMTGTLLTTADTPAPIEGMTVTSVGDTYWGISTAVTDAEGKFCLSVKDGATSTVSAFGTTGVSYFDWKQTGVLASGAATCGGEGTCTDVGTLSGTNLFDECKGNVTSGQNHALLLSSSNTDIDATLQRVLEGLGHTVTLGPFFDKFDGTLDLSAYDAIYLQANASWNGDMPVAGQRQLINWVNCGGGLVTSEWTTWIIGGGRFQLIDAIFPVVRTTQYTTPTSETFIQVTPDATLNAGLPEMFTFVPTNLGGSESNLNPRAGAVIYYDSLMLDAGLIGWEFNLGRVASISTTAGVSDLTDPNFSRLLGNTINWVQRE